ncbi:4Fe-4S ferredoxin [Candidatus Bathyarchaeota archaeon]|nr:4Fe-4S ferredoxin [Candidatus Bathyarchaeota archaeon]
MGCISPIRHVGEVCYPWLLSVWVKTPILRDSEVMLSSACLPLVDPMVFDELSKGKIILLVCPEKEGATYYGKIASIFRSSKPRKLVVVTVDGSPHCFTLHASVNEAEYILGERMDREHYVLSGGKLKKINPDAVRVARYLSLVDELLSKDPSVFDELSKFSEEYRMARRLYKKE